MNEFLFNNPYLAGILFGLFIVFLISLFFQSANIFLHLMILKEYKKIKFESDYFRNILTYSPSEIYYIYNKDFIRRRKDDKPEIYKFRKLFLINLLKMELLGYVDIDFENKENFKIIKKDVVILEDEYKMINNYIFDNIASTNEITLYEIYDYLDRNYNDIFLNKWDSYIHKKVRNRGFYGGNIMTFNREYVKTYYKITIPIIIVINLYFYYLSFIIGLLTSLSFILFLIVGYYFAAQVKVISDSGIYEYRKIKALKKFLKDFTKIDERGLEYSQILDDYIIYASIFGITKETGKYRTDINIRDILIILISIILFIRIYVLLRKLPILLLVIIALIEKFINRFHSN